MAIPRDSNTCSKKWVDSLLEMVKGKFCRHIQYGLLKNI